MWRGLRRLTTPRFTRGVVERAVTSMVAVGEECVAPAELSTLVTRKVDHLRATPQTYKPPACYDGFEPSGRMHIAQGLMKAQAIRTCAASGFDFVILVADWFALMNEKQGGDFSRIRLTGEYFIEVWRALGVLAPTASVQDAPLPPGQARFVWSSDFIRQHGLQYFLVALDIARCNTVPRLIKCGQIMGRAESTSLSAAQLLYPLLQCADVFLLDVDVCQLGTDQRKVNMLAREYAETRRGHTKKLKATELVLPRRTSVKPIILAHHMLSGLLEGQPKMSKSDPRSAIFMEDAAEVVEGKIAGAYCPRVRLGDASGVVNPCLAYFRHIVFAVPVSPPIQLPAACDGGTIACTQYSEVEDAFVTGAVTEAALKAALAAAINQRLQPVRDHFATNPRAQELVAFMRTTAPAPSTPTESAVDGLRALIRVPALYRMPLATVVSLLRAAREAAARGCPVVVLVPDLMEFARGATGAVGAEEEWADVRALLRHNLAVLHAYGLDTAAQVVWESDLATADAGELWLNVITAGRTVSIADATAAAQRDGRPMQHAGCLVATLIQTGVERTLKAVSPSALTQGTVPPLWLSASAPAAEDATPPALAFSREGCAALLCSDDPATISRKLRRAYAAPGDTQTAPVLHWAKFLMAEGVPPALPCGQGDVETAYASGAIHPGDLKAAVDVALSEWHRRFPSASTPAEVVKSEQQRMKRLKLK